MRNKSETVALKRMPPARVKVESAHQKDKNEERGPGVPFQDGRRKILNLFLSMYALNLQLPTEQFPLGEK